MKRLKPTLRQHLAYAIYALALVCSLSIYKSSSGANTLLVAQQHWQAIASENPEQLVSRYSENAVLTRSYGASDLTEVYQGQSIYSAWQKFFGQYQIKDFQVVKQQYRDRAVIALLQITAKSHRGPIVVLSLLYEVQFDQFGKIIREVWKTEPEFRV